MMNMTCKFSIQSLFSLSAHRGVAVSAFVNFRQGNYIATTMANILIRMHYTQIFFAKKRFNSNIDTHPEQETTEQEKSCICDSEVNCCPMHEKKLLQLKYTKKITCFPNIKKRGLSH